MKQQKHNVQIVFPKGPSARREPPRKIKFILILHEYTSRQKHLKIPTGCLQGGHNCMGRREGSPKCINKTMRNTQKSPTKPSISFLFRQTVQGSEGFNKLYKASSSRRPLSVCVPGRGATLYDDLLTQDPPQPGPATD